MAWNVALPPAEWFDSATPALASLLAQLEDTKVVAIDTETTGLNIARDLPLYFSLSWRDTSANRDRRVCLHSDVLPYFKKVFDSTERDWVLANAKYDAHILANAGLPLRGRLVDTQVMHALLYEEQPHGLKAMAAQLLNWRWNDFFDTFKLEQVNETIERFDFYGNRITDIVKRKETIGEMLRRIEVQDRATLVEYASNDAYGTLQVYRKLKDELEDAQTWSLYPEKYRTLWDLFDKIEVPFTRVLWSCERNGILVNAPYLQSLSGPMQAELKKLERDAARITNDPNFNLASTQQLARYCFDVLKLKPVSWTKGGKSGIKTASVDKVFLDAYDDVEIVALKKRHAQVSKLLGTYVEGLQEAMDPHGRIHTRFNQDVARTGRLSSADPNLQNIPRAENDEHHLRGAFIAPPGMELIVADYEALEMRLLAAAAMDKKMIQIFLDGKDIHMGNAEMVFGIPYTDLKAAKKIDKEIKEGTRPESDMSYQFDSGFTVGQCLEARSHVKAVGFGLNYGMKEKKLARSIKKSVEEARKIMDQYMCTYPAVAEFYKAEINRTRETGYAFSVLGRRRYLPEIDGLGKEFETWRAERQAVNVIIQGSAADVAKMAMINCYEADLEGHYGCRMLLQVHDELVFECPQETVKEAMTEIKDWMEHPFETELAVPLTVSIGRGPDWLRAK